MKYNQYIKLKFERYDLNDVIEFEQTGYTGYVLTYKLSEDLMIQVNGSALDKPQLLIKKPQHNYSYHFIDISVERVSILIEDYLQQGEDYLPKKAKKLKND